METVYGAWPETTHRVTPAYVEYRGYDLGFFTMATKFVPAWRLQTEKFGWRRSWRYQKSEGDAIKHAMRCVDFGILCQAMARVIGRPLEQNELPPFEGKSPVY